MGNPEMCLLFLSSMAVVLGVSEAELCPAYCNVGVNTNMTESDRQNLTGTITFTQQSSTAQVSVSVNIQGFSTSDSDTVHGFHVHSFIDTDRSCNSFGSHFNPDNVDHGMPNATKANRHAGDLGNIIEDSSGNVVTTLQDGHISLDPTSTYYIVGRSMVIHKTIDDLGLGGDAESLKTGNAGARLGCCVIMANADCSSATNVVTPNFLILFGMIFFALLRR